MTREEVKKLLAIITSVYPNYVVKAENKSGVVDAWTWALSDYPAEEISASLKIYVKTNKTGFAPSVSQLIDGIYKPDVINQLTEGEAWALVKKAIRNGNYEAKEMFEELPETVQKAVGSHRMIQEWALLDSEEVNSVIMSNFQRSYRAVLEKKAFNDRVPQQIKDRLENRGEMKEIANGTI